ncbi:MAG: putative transrane protein [Planctomycetaceae bacterium]|nr:putative transrane protein [Planctomycetaceae bacterium]
MTSQMQESRRYWWLALVVCGIAFVLRLAMWWLQGDRLNQDIDAYLEIARHLVAGDGFSTGQPLHLTAYRPPLYPLLIAAVFACGGTTATLGLIQVVLGTIVVGLTLRIGHLLNLGRASFLAAGFVAIDPLLLQYTSLPMTETLCATLVAVWCWVMLEFPSWQTLPASASPTLGASATGAPLFHGVCFGLICLCRPGFLAAVGLAGVWMLTTTAGNRRSNPIRPRLVAALFSLLGMAVVLAPWMVRNTFVIGKATPATTHGGYTLLLANNPVFYHEVAAQPWGTVWQGESLNRWQTELESQMAAEGIQPADEVSRDQWMYQKAWTHIRAEPALFSRACLWRGLRFWDLAPWRIPTGYSKYLFWGTAIFYGLLTCGMLVGLGRLSALEWRTWSVLLLLPLTLWLTHLVYWTDMRMRAPVIPILALLAARALRSPDQETPLNRQATL